MKILIVSSGNSKNGTNPVVSNQILHLLHQGVQAEYFPIKGKGLKAYFNSIFLLREFLRGKKYDVVHAHYSLSGFVASLSVKGSPVVVSLMGSEVYSGGLHLLTIKIFAKHLWTKTIVKSQSMLLKVGLPDLQLIPNGVDLERFSPMDRESSCYRVGFDSSVINISFFSNPARREKNFILAETVTNKLADKSIKLNIIYDKKPEEIPYYINASDIILLTSNHEGSPNIIKEAMACNCVVVATDVGDISWLFEDVKGCYLSSTKDGELSEKLSLAIAFVQNGEKSNGRIKIEKLGLDSINTAKKLIQIYEAARYEYSH